MSICIYYLFIMCFIYFFIIYLLFYNSFKNLADLRLKKEATKEYLPNLILFLHM